MMLCSLFRLTRIIFGRNAILMIAAIGFTQLGFNAAAVADEWRPISEGDSGVRLYAPEFTFSEALKVQSQFADAWTVNYDLASIFYGRAVPGGTLRVPHNLRDELSYWPQFSSDSGVEWGKEGSAAGPHGDMAYQRFRYNRHDCVTFAHGWGVRRSIGPQDYPKILTGYICKPNTQQMLSDAEIEKLFLKIKVEK